MKVTKELQAEPLWYLKGLPYGDYLTTDHWQIVRQNYRGMVEDQYGNLCCEWCGLDVVDQVEATRHTYTRYDQKTTLTVECGPTHRDADHHEHFFMQDRFARFHVHHKTYERLGEEHWDDLVLLCSPCHNVVHFPTSHAAQWWITYQLKPMWPTFEAREFQPTNTRSLNGKAGER
jgi:5-methylcytosine-specific restriction endonuclease McrA